MNWWMVFYTLCVTGMPVLSQAQAVDTYRVTTLLDAPYVMEEGDGSKFKGFTVDLLNMVAKMSNFTTTLKTVKDGKYGMMTLDGNWNGAIGELVANEADIAALPLIVTDVRKLVVEFSRPFIVNGHQILIKKPELHNDPLKVLFEPFSLVVWILVMVVCWVMGAFLIIVNKFSPSEWSKVQEDEDPTLARNSFDAKNAFFFVHSTLTWQGYKEAPRSAAGRIATSMWFSFVFFMIIAYTANLTALLLARGPNKPVVPFKTFHEMASQSLIPYGAIENVRLLNEFKNSNDSVYQRMLAYMDVSGNSFRNIDDGIKKIRTSPAGYAAIIESLSAEYVASRNCDLMVVGESINPEGLAFACRKDLRGVCNLISEAFRDIRESGEMHMLIKKWFRSGTCTDTDIDDYISKQETAKIWARPLTVADLSLAFVVLLIGLVLGAILLLVEVLVHRYRKKKANTNSEPVRMTAANGRGQSDTADDDEADKAPIAAAEP